MSPDQRPAAPMWVRRWSGAPRFIGEWERAALVDRQNNDSWRFVRQDVGIMSWVKLGDEVRRRRRDLDLTQREVAERGGPGVATLRAIENNQSGHPLSRRMRRALEDALEWESGSVDAILAGGAPTPAQPKAQVASLDRFSLARQVVALKETFARHAGGVSAEARDALKEQITRSAREAEESIAKLMPWLSDDERSEAIELLVQLRAPL